MHYIRNVCNDDCKSRERFGIDIRIIVDIIELIISFSLNKGHHCILCISKPAISIYLQVVLFYNPLFKN